MKRIMMILVLLMMASTAWAQVSLDVVWNQPTVGAPLSVAFNRNRVITGEVVGPDNASTVHVRGLNANTGGLQWEDTIAGSGVFVDAAGNDAFAAITFNGKTLIRSYQQRTGTLQWSTTIPLLSTTAFGVRGNRVLLAGYMSISLPNGFSEANGFLFVLNRTTGDVLWSAQLDTASIPPPLADAFFWDFDRSGTDLIVAGERRPLISGVDFLVLRDYRVSDGHLKWETLEPNLGGPFQVQLENGFVYVSGRVNGSPFGGFMAAYRLTDGVLAWNAPAGSDRPMFTASEAGVFIVSTFPVLVQTTIIERRDPSTGVLVWRQTIPSEGPYTRLIRRVDLLHGYLVVISLSIPQPPPFPVPPGWPTATVQVVRLYDPHGNLVFEDQTEQIAIVTDYDIVGSRFAAIGFVSGAAGFVRMYELQTGGIQP